MGMGKGRCAGMTRAANFKVRTKQVYGGSEIKALAQLNITETELTGDTAMTQLPGGFSISWNRGLPGAAAATLKGGYWSTQFSDIG